MSGAERTPIVVPDFQQIIMAKMSNLGMNPHCTQINLGMLETEDLLLEVQKVKAQLQQELLVHRRYQEQIAQQA